MSKQNPSEKTNNNIAENNADQEVVENTPYCGIIMPISASGDYSSTHWERVREIISEAVRAAKHEPRIVSDGNNSSIIHARIVTNIYQDDIVICDVSNMNPNVMLEFGLRLASQKPIIVIKDSITKYSFDASPIEYLQYPRDLNYFDILEFKTKLTQSITDALAAIQKKNYKSFLEHFTIPNLKLSTVKTVEVDQIEAINILLNKVSKIEDSINPRKSNKGTLPSFKAPFSSVGMSLNDTAADYLANIIYTKIISLDPSDNKYMKSLINTHYANRMEKIENMIARDDNNILMDKLDRAYYLSLPKDVQDRILRIVLDTLDLPPF